MFYLSLSDSWGYICYWRKTVFSKPLKATRALSHSEVVEQSDVEKDSLYKQNVSVILTTHAGTDSKQARTVHFLHHAIYTRESQVLPIAEMQWISLTPSSFSF